MTRQEAKEIAETVTEQELKQMFFNAQNGIKDWTKISRVNKGLTKGAAFNILTKCSVNVKDKLITTNMIWEFGEWLPNYEKKIVERKPQYKPTHQEPDKIDDNFWGQL